MSSVPFAEGDLLPSLRFPFFLPALLLLFNRVSMRKELHETAGGLKEVRQHAGKCLNPTAQPVICRVPAFGSVPSPQLFAPREQKSKMKHMALYVISSYCLRGH